ncbi:MAG: protein kinase [Sandaracinus sp.]
MQVREGTRLGGYRVVRKIGEGGMGAVWEGVHERLQKRVALKTLHEQFARDAGQVARFTREGRAASRIRHGHVIDVTDVGMEDGTPFLVMELLEGESVAGLIRRVGPLPLDAIADIALPVMDALEAAHAAGIIHRDLKPENIFLARSRSGTDAHPMVLDFGISAIEDEVRMTKTAHFMGTPHYMSPEQAQSAHGVDGRSDQFSLGLVLFEMVTGRRALVGNSVLEVVHRVSTEGAIRLGIVRPDLPASFTSIVDKMTERDPGARFPSMRAAGGALFPFASPRGQAMWGPAFAPGGAPMYRSSVPLLDPATAPSAPSAPSFGSASIPISLVSMRSSAGTQDAPRPSFSAPAGRSSLPAHAQSPTPSAQLPSTRPAAPQPTPSVRPRASASPSEIGTEPTVDASSRTPRASEIPARPASGRSPVLLAVIAIACVIGAVGIAFVVGTTLARQQQLAAATPPTTTLVALPPAPIPAPETTVAPPTSVSPTIDIRLRAIPATAEIVLDGTVVGTGTYAGTLVRDGIPHILEVRADGFIPHDIQFLDIAPVATIQLEAVPRHHHGPIVAQRSQMTASGLVSSTGEAIVTEAPAVAPPTTTQGLAPATVVAPVQAPEIAAGAGAGTEPAHGTSVGQGAGTGVGIAPPPSTTVTVTPTPPPTSAAAPPPTTRAQDDWAAEPGDELAPFDPR